MIQNVWRFLATLSLITLLTNISIIVAQPQTLWIKTFGGDDWDDGCSVRQTGDGGFIITGNTYSFGAGKGDVWLIKTDANGNQMWSQTFGGSNYDTGRFVQQTADSGYIITGWTNSFGGNHEDLWLIKTDADGKQIWNQIVDRGSRDTGQSVKQTAEGGYIIVGSTRSTDSGDDDIWLIKTDSTGNLKWERTFGDSNYDGASSVLQTADKGYIIAGSKGVDELGNQDVWLIKTDPNGNMQWNRFFGGNKNDGSHCIGRTTDGGYIVTGFTWSFGAGNADLWLIKTDSSGNEIWNRTFGGIKHDDGSSIQQVKDGGYIITGWTESYGSGDMDIWLIKIDANGNMEWSQTFGGSNIDLGYSVQQTIDNGYILTGYGNHARGGGSNADLWLIRLAPEAGTVVSKSEGTPQRFSMVQNYPNPFNSVTTIIYKLPEMTLVNVSIYSVTGELIETLVNKYENVGFHSVRWNASAVGSGVYFFKITAGDNSFVRKCLVLK